MKGRIAACPTQDAKTRLRADFFDRRKPLEDAVQEDKAKVDEAYRLRSQIRP